MGLDMSLYRQREGAPPVEKVLNDEGFDFEKWKATHDDLQVAYWRKANAIHAWFVDTVQGGVDECQYSEPIGREALAGLVERCRRILSGEPPTILESRGGFFFGSTDYDEHYMRDLRDTIEQLEPLIAERNSDTFIYNSSW